MSQLVDSVYRTEDMPKWLQVLTFPATAAALAAYAFIYLLLKVKK